MKEDKRTRTAQSIYPGTMYRIVLKEEVEWLRTMIKPEETGHIHTTIRTLEHRIKELEE